MLFFILCYNIKGGNMKEYLDKIEFNNEIVSMYTKLNENLTASIIKAIKKGGDVSSFTKAQFQVLVQTNGQKLFNEALKDLKGISVKRKKELQNIFNSTITENMKEYIDLYEYTKTEFKLTEEQLKILINGINRTNDEFNNFSNTIANSTNATYVNAMNNAYIQTVSGGIPFDEVFKSTSNQLAQQGILLNGKSIEAYTRQALKYSIRENMREIDKNIDEELGCDGVQVNISPNCRDDHIPINGKMFTNEEWQKYKHLIEEYGCQHYTTGTIEGVTKNRYSDKEIKEADNRQVEYQGKKVPYYEATQKQRALERQIRYAKREKNILEKSKTVTQEQILEANKKIKHYQKVTKKYCEETGLERDYSREYVAS